MERNILQTAERRKANWIGHIWRKKCFIIQVIEGKIEWREGKEEDVSSCWVTLGKRKGTEDWKRNRYVEHCGELALERAMDLSSDKL